jgi:outer membrane protein TolC
MPVRRRRSRFLAAFLGALGSVGALAHPAIAQEQLPLPKPVSAPPVLAPAAIPSQKPPYPINLPTAMQLAGAQPLDIALAQERIRIAAAQLARAHVLWLPTIYSGIDYFRHDGRIQDVAGKITDTSKSTFMAGAGPYAVFAISDAIFGPLAARQELRAREAALQTAQNDTLLAVAESYFNVQQARGELAAAEETARRAEDLIRRTEKLAPGLVPPVEVSRSRVEASRRRQAVHTARERWLATSADLARLLRLDASILVEPIEPPHLQITLVPPDSQVDELIPMALTNRPELSSQQAVVQATLERLRQERLRPLIPSLVLRGASTNPAGLLGGGTFGGGQNDTISKFGGRIDIDVELLWELQNLGFGNRARVNERRAERELALLELFRIQDRVAAEVVQAQAQVQSAAARLTEAESAVKDAIDSADKNLEGLGQTQGTGKLVLLIRPQEAVAAVQALAQAYVDYFGAAADYDRAQFRLYRALGHPAQSLGNKLGEGSAPCPASATPSESDWKPNLSPSPASDHVGLTPRRSPSSSSSSASSLDTAAKQSFAPLRSQAELGNEREAPSRSQAEPEQEEPAALIPIRVRPAGIKRN